jgi:hypothetical protein
VSIFNTAMSDTTYVFIDGNYLRKVADELIGEMFGTAAELDFNAIRPGVQSRRLRNRADLFTL